MLKNILIFKITSPIKTLKIVYVNLTIINSGIGYNFQQYFKDIIIAKNNKNYSLLNEDCVWIIYVISHVFEET